MEVEWPPMGAVVCAKYRIERLIGRGGMGTVMLARHLRLDEDVALKFLTPQAMKKPDVVARFEREARAVVKLKSPHVTRVLDVEVAENGTPFIVMEYLEGQTLSGLVRGGAALPVELAAEYMLQACEAVAEAHVMGIVHRDLKPGNLFLTTGADGSAVVKVLDFGVSKIGGMDKTSGAEIETLPDAIVGSPPYMSPEQLRSSKTVDARTDIWALGVVLFEIVTGRMPFAADNLHEHYTKLMLEDPPIPSDVRPDLPKKIDAIIAKCLEREPADRYANIGELARDLAELAPERARASAERVERTLATTRSPRSTSRPSLPAPPISLPPSLHTTGDATKLTAPRRARRTGRVVMIVVSAAVLGTAAFVVTKMQSTASTAPTTMSTPTTTTTATPTTTTTATPTALTVTTPATTSASTMTTTMTIASTSASTSTSTRATATITRPVRPAASVTVDLDHRK